MSGEQATIHEDQGFLHEASVIERYSPRFPHRLQPVGDLILDCMRNPQDYEKYCFLPTPEELGIVQKEGDNYTFKNPDGAIIVDNPPNGKCLVLLEAKLTYHKKKRAQLVEVAGHADHILRCLKDDPSLASKLLPGIRHIDILDIGYSPTDPRNNRVVHGTFSKVSIQSFQYMQFLGELEMRRVQGQYLEDGCNWAIDLKSPEGEVMALYEQEWLTPEEDFNQLFDQTRFNRRRQWLMHIDFRWHDCIAKGEDPVEYAYRLRDEAIKNKVKPDSYAFRYYEQMLAIFMLRDDHLSEQDAKRLSRYEVAVEETKLRTSRYWDRKIKNRFNHCLTLGIDPDLYAQQKLDGAKEQELCDETYTVQFYTKMRTRFTELKRAMLIEIASNDM